MKIVNFTKAGMRNFSCYTDLFEFPFPNDKLILITGPNGSGKTTIYDSVPFTLYGETTKGTKSSDVVNNIVGKNCFTYVEFTIEHENNILDKYRVERYVKDSKLGDTVLLFKNDNPKPYKKGQKEVLPEIENLLVNHKLFLNTLLFGQKVKDFFTDLNDNEKKEIFRKVLQLDNYVLYYDETNKRMKKSNESLTEVRTNLDLNERLQQSNNLNIEHTKENIKNFEIKKTDEIQALNREIQTLNEDLSELIEISQEYENINDLELKQIQKEIFSVGNDLTNAKVEKDHQLKSLKNSRDSKENEINSKAAEVKSQETLKRSETLSELNASYQKIKSKFEADISSFKNTIDSNTLSINRNNKEIDKNKIKIQDLSNALNKPNPVCPTCGEELKKESVKTHLTNELSDLNNSNQRMVKENEDHQRDIDQAIKLRQETGELFTQKQNEYELNLVAIDGDYNQRIKEIEDRKSKVIDQLDESYNKKVDDIENSCAENIREITSKLNDLQIKERDLEGLLQEKKKNSDQIFKVKSDIEISKTKLREKENLVYDTTILDRYVEEEKRLKTEWLVLNSEKERLTEELEILDFWKSAFSSTGIPSLLIDESIPFLNKTVSEYLDMIGGRYVVSFDTISATKAGEYRDKINVNVLDTQTKANNRKQLSGGQTRVIDIAILLSLCDLQNNVQNMKTNILLLDEIFDSLDDQNIGFVSNLLRTLVHGKAINIISHRHIDSIEADEVMRLF